MRLHTRRDGWAGAGWHYDSRNCAKTDDFLFLSHGTQGWLGGWLRLFTSKLCSYIVLLSHCTQGWLGGWLLPQEKSYWALKGPHGWWVFGLDLALTGDIDARQLRWVVLLFLPCLSF